MSLTFTLTSPAYAAPDYYDGDYTVTPSSSAQTITTNGKTLEDDITVEAIPDDYIVPSGTISITANGTHAVTEYDMVSVNVEPDLQSKTVTPGASAQVVEADDGYDGLDQVTVNAVPSGSATTPATTITANPSISVSGSGLITATASASQSIAPAVEEGYVGEGTAGTVTVNGSATSQLDTDAGRTITPSASQQTVSVSGKYMTGDIVINAIPGEYIVPSGTYNISANGTYDVTDYETAEVALQFQSKNVTPSNTAQTVTPDSGYAALSQVVVAASSGTDITDVYAYIGDYTNDVVTLTTGSLDKYYRRIYGK